MRLFVSPFLLLKWLTVLISSLPPLLTICSQSLHSSTEISVQQSRSPSPSSQDTLTLRALVTTKDAGVIIGKGGKNVADLREQTGVKAGVSKVVPGVHERVLTVSGDVDAVAKVISLPFLFATSLFTNSPFTHTLSLLL